MKIGMLFIAIFAITSSACSEVDKVANQNIDNMKIQLSSGYEVQISKTKKAKVYGTDMCFDESLFRLDSCTTLTGNTEINVTLVLLDNKELKETWLVIKDNAQYTLKRPNGYLISKAN